MILFAKATEGTTNLSVPFPWLQISLGKSVTGRMREQVGTAPGSHRP